MGLLPLALQPLLAGLGLVPLALQPLLAGLGLVPLALQPQLAALLLLVLVLVGLQSVVQLVSFGSLVELQGQWKIYVCERSLSGQPAAKP